MQTIEQISERAYALWEADGCPDGRDQEYWFRAESQLRDEGLLDEQPLDEMIVPLAALPVH